MRRALIIAILLVAGCTSPVQDDTLTIGAILPLSGPAAIWGEALQEGMELAKQELLAEGTVVEIIYEDSQAKSTVGVTAYTKLSKVDDVDIVFSAFSRVSVPLIPLADADQIPLVMTLVAAKGAANQSPYSFRFFSTTEQYAKPHFDKMEPGRYKTISILYVNDEYGLSLSKMVKELAETNGITVVYEEAFDAGAIDFRTQFTEIQDTRADALMFISSVPSETLAALEQWHALEIEGAFFAPSTVLSLHSVIEDAGEGAEEAYTIAHGFTLGLTGEAFRQRYETAYGQAPIYAAAYGWDMVQLVVQASRTGETDILALETYEGANGNVIIQPDGEINTDTYSVRIENGELVSY